MGMGEACERIEQMKTVFNTDSKKRSLLHLPHTQKPLHSSKGELTQMLADFDTCEQVATSTPLFIH